MVNDIEEMSLIVDMSYVRVSDNWIGFMSKNELHLSIYSESSLYN
jgi:hypothetical protein